jgi:hypothetical protein
MTDCGLGFISLLNWLFSAVVGGDDAAVEYACYNNAVSQRLLNQHDRPMMEHCSSVILPNIEFDL